ncbi:hypothetical protein P5G86_02160 [Paenibacillus jamilae]|nr:hypothetical protein [Bacillus thuringiensis]MEB4838904.1 hypothetical protein [Paenibacillus jamilae]MEB8622353.1 hypothetical protein [Bacillus cereus]MEB9275036.1 hypothetical protein [Bacillus cereus]MEC3036512.1 hypothetical protein [Bacillus cereus]UJP60084.1 hypothetical protein JRY14_29165 [Bacillus thuringiensis]
MRFNQMKHNEETTLIIFYLITINFARLRSSIETKNESRKTTKNFTN